MQHFLESGGLYSAEYRVESPDGIQTWVSVSGNATFAPDGHEISGMIGTVQDITARRSQESALRQSEKLAATGRLAATIAHEINNPLEAVTNLIYLSRTDPDVPQPVQFLLETADAELARVAQIAQQTLGFYRDTTRPVEIRLNDLLRSVVDLFERKMISRKIACTLDLEPDLCINGLQGEIRQVFSNLIVNAIDSFSYSPDHTSGKIHIRGRHLQVPPLRGRPAVSILICDQGSGISASARQRIFSPFFTTKLSVGTGLGLWVTRGFVEKQGGRIHFRSRTEAPSGTTFRVVLPVHMPLADHPDAMASRLPA
jgi:signal transduction histidine kinase